ncbi:MAG: PEP-CTERM sorting domain-containing protein [Planctomycetota bacterium]|nr:MAG: PEP-CTERM sorting domain-containing protein [Planctomycetota bacterium]
MNRFAFASCLFAAAGLASAQGVMTITWSASDTGNGDGIVEPGESAVMTMWAEMSPGQTGFAGSIYDLNGDALWQAGTVESYENLLGELTDDGTLNGDNSITNIESFQLPPAFNGNFVADNPIALYRVTWTPASYDGAFVSIDSTHINFDVYTDTFGTSESYTGEVFGGLIKVVPAPSSLALLGLGGLMARRRR